MKIMTRSTQDTQRLRGNKIEAGIQRGLDDVEASRYNEMTPDYLAAMKARFKLSQKDRLPLSLVNELGMLDY